MKVLVGCEESQAVCLAFRAMGHEAFSCDLQACSGGFPEWHLRGDVLRSAYSGKFDLLIAHPPCTYLAYSGTAYWNDPGRLQKRLEALQFFAQLWLAPIKRICLENPKGCASPAVAKYSQEIQPYFFGDREYKTTWLWLKNLPKLRSFRENTLFDQRTYADKPQAKAFRKDGQALHWTDMHAPSGVRAKLRSKTFPAIARAMAEQWGNL